MASDPRPGPSGQAVPDWEDPRRVLSRHGLVPKRGFSQNFLVTRHAVERIADALEIVPGERVIELGPGLGTLTGELLRRGARVIAVDADPDMLQVLAKELGHVSTLEEWDEYEWRYSRSIEQYLVEHPDDPDAEAMRTRIRAWRKLYLTGGRHYLGFGLYLFRTPPPA